MNTYIHDRILKQCESNNSKSKKNTFAFCHQTGSGPPNHGWLSVRFSRMGLAPLGTPENEVTECQDVLVWHVEETVGPCLSASELSLDLRPVAPGRGTETESADL